MAGQEPNANLDGGDAAKEKDEDQTTINKLRSELGSLRGIDGVEQVVSAKQKQLEDLLAKKRAEQPLSKQLELLDRKLKSKKKAVEDLDEDMRNLEEKLVEKKKQRVNIDSEISVLQSQRDRVLQEEATSAKTSSGNKEAMQKHIDKMQALVKGDPEGQASLDVMLANIKVEATPDPIITEMELDHEEEVQMDEILDAALDAAATSGDQPDAAKRLQEKRKKCAPKCLKATRRLREERDASSNGKYRGQRGSTVRRQNSTCPRTNWKVKSSRPRQRAGMRL